MIRIEYTNGKIKLLASNQLRSSIIDEVKDACKKRIKDYDHCYVGDVVREMQLNKDEAFREQVAISLFKSGRFVYEKLEYKNQQDFKILPKVKSTTEKWTMIATWVAAIAASIGAIEVLCRWLK